MKESLAARQAALLRQNAELDEQVEAIDLRRRQQQQEQQHRPAPSISKAPTAAAQAEIVVTQQDADYGGSTAIDAASPILSDPESDAAASSPVRSPPLKVDFSASLDATSFARETRVATDSNSNPPSPTSATRGRLVRKKSANTAHDCAPSTSSRLRRYASTSQAELSPLRANAVAKGLAGGPTGDKRRGKASRDNAIPRDSSEQQQKEQAPDKEGETSDGHAGSPEGLGLEATLRYQKARLRVLQDEVDVARQEIHELRGAQNGLNTRIEELNAENTALKKKQQQTQQLLEKQQELSAAQESKQKILESQLASAQAKAEELQRAEKQTSQQFRSKDVRLNRALEELEKVKAQLQDERRSQNEQTVSRSEYEQLFKDNKKLEKQKNELLLAFKKQMKLIDLLKRQRIHMEAAKMLSFTEEEFTKTLELG